MIHLHEFQKKVYEDRNRTVVAMGWGRNADYSEKAQGNIRVMELCHWYCSKHDSRNLQILTEL